MVLLQRFHGGYSSHQNDRLPSDSGSDLWDGTRTSVSAATNSSTFDLKVVHFINDIFKQATDVTTVGPMLLASPIGQVGKLALLRPAIAKPAVTWLGRVLALNLAPVLGGFGAETVAFSLGSRGLTHLLHGPVPWDPASIINDVGMAGLSLGLLKVGSFAGSRGVQWARGMKEFQAQLWSKADHRALFWTGQVAGYLGLVASHGIQAKFFPEAHLPGGNIWIDALGTQIALGIGAHGGRSLLGVKFHNLEQGLALQAHHLSQEIQPKVGPFRWMHQSLQSVATTQGPTQGSSLTPGVDDFQTMKMEDNSGADADSHSVTEVRAESEPGSTSIWGRLQLALAAALEWRGKNPKKIAHLQEVLRGAAGDPKNLRPLDAKSLLDLASDRRARSYFGKRISEQDSRLLGLKGLLQTRIEADELVPGEVKQGEKEKPPTRSTPSHDSKTKGFVLRDYQVEFVNFVDRAMGAAAASKGGWSVEKPKDRGYLLSPWQTGKSKIIGPIANRAQIHFPGKKTLVLTPYKIVKQQIVDDLVQTFAGKVSVYDAKGKDLRGDVIVASVYSLVRHFDSHRKKLRLDPEKIGLVVVDEITYTLASSWQQILSHLGFVDAKGKIRRTRGKFALGLGASGEREDGRHVREFFGNTFLAGKGLNWFMQNGYMHEILGLEVSYGTSPTDFEKIEGPEETVVVMRDTKENRRRISDTYRRYLNGSKALVFVESVEMANHLAKEFNRAYGKGYAASVTEQTSDKETEEITHAFNQDRGPKVLISIRKLALSFRALNTDGVIHGYQTTSWNLFAQRSGRALGRQENEPRRTVLIITMEGRGIPLDRAQNANTLLGIYETPVKNKVFRPQVPEGKPKGRPQGVRRRNKSALLHVKPDRIQGLRIGANRFGRAMQEVFADEFNREIDLMSERLGLKLADCGAYLQGMLPGSYETVERIGQRIGVDPEPLTQAWLGDQIALIEAAYPAPEGTGPKAQALTRLVRLALLRQSKTGSVLNVAQDNASFKRYAAAFKGDLPAQPSPLRDLFQLIVDSGVVEESSARSAIGGYVEERFPDGKHMWQPDREHQDGEFDHRHIDALEAAKTRSLQDLSQRQELLALHLSEASPYPLVFPSPGALAHEHQKTIEIRRVLKTLTPEEEKILGMYFGIGSGEEHTLKEIGDAFEVGRESITQIAAKGLRKLRHPTRNRRLVELVEWWEQVESEYSWWHWHDVERRPYLERNIREDQEEREELELDPMRRAIEGLRGENRELFERFAAEAKANQVPALTLFRQLAEQKNTYDALPYIRALTELAAVSRSSWDNQHYAQWYVKNLNTKFLEKAAWYRNPRAFLALKWLGERGNGAAQGFWYDSHTVFLSLREKEAELPKTGLYLINSEGEGHKLWGQDTLVLADLPPHPLDRPALLLVSEGGTVVTQQVREISRHHLSDEDLKSGYPLSIDGEPWILKKYIGEEAITTEN